MVLTTFTFVRAAIVVLGSCPLSVLHLFNAIECTPQPCVIDILQITCVQVKD